MFLWFIPKQEFKSVGIFAISFFLTEIYLFFYLCFLQCTFNWLTILDFYLWKICSYSPPELSCIGIVLISLKRFWNINYSIFEFLTAQPHGTLLLERKLSVAGIPRFYTKYFVILSELANFSDFRAVSRTISVSISEFPQDFFCCRMT